MDLDLLFVISQRLRFPCIKRLTKSLKKRINSNILLRDVELLLAQIIFKAISLKKDSYMNNI